VTDGTAGFAELCATSNFTFLRGASHPEELVERAAALGLEAIAIADVNSLAGVVRAHARLKTLAKEAAGFVDAPRPQGVTGEDVRARARALRGRKDPSGRQEAPDPPPPVPEDAFIPKSIPRLIIAARLVLIDSAVEWVVLPKDRTAYARLCRLLTVGKRRAKKGECELQVADLCEWGEGLILIALPSLAADSASSEREIAAMARHFPGAVFLGGAPRYDGQDATRFDALARLSIATGAPMIATNTPLMHRAARRRVADVLTCLREHITIDRIGRHALANAEQRLKSAGEMSRMFARYPEAVARTLEIARTCTFSLDDLRYEYPDEVVDGENPQQRLERLTREGLAWRYPDGAPDKIVATVRRELALVGKLGFAPYFLTVHEIVDFARGRGILCQGRGSAANSVVCYALGITEADPELISGVFERFISEARGEPPDIDVDFEHERREEVIQHIYDRYGRERAGLCATVIHFRSRAAIREVGKVMGLSTDVVSAIAGQIWGWSSEGIDPQRLVELGLDPTDRRLRQTLELTAEIVGFPRHLSQHVGGFVITAGRLDELVPIENAAMAARTGDDRTVIEWDKDDIDTLGILKVDVLALGMLTCLRKTFDTIADHGGQRFTLATLRQEDGKVYDMLCAADSLGVFQVESRAQMNFLPRMRPRTFYDLVIEVAIVRPGPIQGDMVHPYIRRRNGDEDVDYVKDELRAILGKTLGVPLFQEQAMQIAMTAADFTPDEADGLRRAMATFRKTGTIQNFGHKFVTRMVEKGYPAEFAERCFKQIEGFGEYGFPESHAASFALLVYASAWAKRYHPAAFTCALLNSQPMGFYAPAQIVRDAREHGVEVRPVCVNASWWDCTLEPLVAPAPRTGERGWADTDAGRFALRLGLRLIKGVGEEDAGWISAARGNGYADIESLQRRAGLHPRVVRRLAEADAFASLDLSRRGALWEAQAIPGKTALPLFADTFEGEGIIEPIPDLPPMSRGEEVVEDYVATRLSLKDHPLTLLRPALASEKRGPVPHPCAALIKLPDRWMLSVTGLVITRQRPGTASGVIFLTLEDETGVANIVVWPKIYDRFRRAVIAGRLLRVHGQLQREGVVTHLVARTIEDISPMLDRLGEAGAIDVSSNRADHTKRAMQAPSQPRARHPREQAKALFPSRDFH